MNLKRPISRRKSSDKNQSKKFIESKTREFLVNDLLDDYDDYQTFVRRISEGKGISHGWF